jgi:predicted metalloprotease with PDZ domain
VSVNLGPKVKWNHFWFDEGFNDYYANLLNYRAGVISDKQYIDKINEQLEDHYKFYMYRQELISSTCGDAMSLLEEDYNFILFYNVGMIVALDMDSIFKKVSKLRLENFIKKSVQKACKNTPCNISKKIFLEELSKGAKHIGSYIDKYIINFSPIPPLQLPESIPEVRSKLSYKLYDSVPNYGFDMNKTSCTGVVYGINKKGNAYKKGLRNGMKITKFSEVNIYEKEWHISVEIEKTDLTKESIRYSPLQEGLIPYYELVE